MDVTVLNELVEKFGLPVAFCLVLFFVLFKVITYLFKKLETQQEIVNNELREQIKELKQESKNEKKIFQQTIKEFSRSIDEFSTVNRLVGELKIEIGEIKSDIKDLKDKS